jgi:hypothetical protein
LWALLVVGGVTVIFGLLFEGYPWLGYQAVGLLELFAVLLIAIYLGRGPALLAALVYQSLAQGLLAVLDQFQCSLEDLHLQ